MIAEHDVQLALGSGVAASVVVQEHLTPKKVVLWILLGMLLLLLPTALVAPPLEVVAIRCLLFLVHLVVRIHVRCLALTMLLTVMRSVVARQRYMTEASQLIELLQQLNWFVRE